MDHRAWEGLLTEQIARNGRGLFAVAMRMLRSAHAAEDACQIVFAKAWQAREQVIDPDALGGWLMQAIVNECLQMLRRRRVERKWLSQQQPQDSKAAAPDELALKESVQQALCELAEPTRTIVVLRIMQGVSGNEVGRLMQCSASEVSRRLHEGMEQLRCLLIRSGAAEAGG